MIYQAYRTNRSNYFTPTGYGDFVGYVSLCYGSITIQHIHARMLEAAIVNDTWFSATDIVHSLHTRMTGPQEITVMRRSNRHVVFYLVPVAGQEDEMYLAKPKPIKKVPSQFTTIDSIRLEGLDWAQLQRQYAAVAAQPQPYAPLWDRPIIPVARNIDNAAQAPQAVNGDLNGMLNIAVAQPVNPPAQGVFAQRYIGELELHRPEPDLFIDEMAQGDPLPPEGEDQ
jgi:hypothetical protein